MISQKHVKVFRKATEYDRCCGLFKVVMSRNIK